MKLVRIVPLLVTGLLMAACSDGEIEVAETDTAVETVEETTSPERPQETAAATPTMEPLEVVGDFPYDMSNGLPLELAELMYDQCQGEYVAIVEEERGVAFNPYSVSDNGGTYQTVLEDTDSPLVIIQASFTGGVTKYPWECRIWYDPDTGEWDSLDVRAHDETAAERPDDHAVNTCHMSVETKLVSPASAEFGEPIFEEQDDGSWIISGHVDAMNRLGVPLRYDWQCGVKYNTLLASWYSTGATVTER